MPPFPSLVGPSATGASRLANSERTVGFYLEKNEGAGAVFPWSMLPFPGFTVAATVPEGPGRGLWAQDGRCLRVAGYKVYETDSTLTETHRGDVVRNANPAQLVSSGDGGREVAISSGGALYIFNLDTNVFSAAVSGVTADFVGYLSNRFLALDVAQSMLRCSDLLDGLTWNPTQFVQRGSAGDRWVSLLVCGAYIYLFGSETSDVYYDADEFPFPFALVPGGTIPVGIAAPYAAGILAGVPIWIASSEGGALTVVRGNGPSMPTRISSHALETAMRGYSTVADAASFVLEWEGHGFFVLTFPTAGATWVYDASSDQWTEQPSWNSTTGREEAHRALHHAYAFGKHLLDDRSTGDLYQVSGSTYTENGQVMRRVRRVPIPKLTAENYWIFLSELELFLDTGIGLQSGQGSDPQVTLRISRDGGQTWGNEITCSAGAAGDYFTRVIFNQLGRYRDGLGVIELVFTDPVPWRLHGGAFDATRGIR